MRQVVMYGNMCGSRGVPIFYYRSVQGCTIHRDQAEGMVIVLFQPMSAIREQPLKPAGKMDRVGRVGR